MNTSTIKLDIGAGASPHKGFQSVDLYAAADYQDDITRMKQFADNSVSQVRTAHVLEHLQNDDVSKAFAQIYRILTPGGIWRIEVPDLIWVLQNFLDTPEEKRWGWKLQTVFGLQNHEGEFHRTGFSSQRLGDLLLTAGFVKIRVSNNFSKRYNQGVIRAKAFKPDLPQKSID